ncbi:unnamed protein product [Withania somnifera]
MDVPVKKPQDNGQKTLVSDDILARRLKNRERQCRYRERKRLKAGAMKVLGADQLASLPVKVLSGKTLGCSSAARNISG